MPSNSRPTGRSLNGVAQIKTLFILNDAPYGSERSHNALRLAQSQLTSSSGYSAATNQILGREQPFLPARHTQPEQVGATIGKHRVIPDVLNAALEYGATDKRFAAFATAEHLALRQQLRGAALFAVEHDARHQP